MHIQELLHTKERTPYTQDIKARKLASKSLLSSSKTLGLVVSLTTDFSDRRLLKALSHERKNQIAHLLNLLNVREFSSAKRFNDSIYLQSPYDQLSTLMTDDKAQAFRVLLDNEVLRAAQTEKAVLMAKSHTLKNVLSTMTTELKASVLLITDKLVVAKQVLY